MQRATVTVGVGSVTPWGAAQYADAIGGAGVVAVSTASHGGLYVPRELLPLVSEEGRAYAQKYTQSEHWYEEDCGWAYVAEAFPEIFTAEQREHARLTLEWMHRDEIASAMTGLDGQSMSGAQ